MNNQTHGLFDDCLSLRKVRSPETLMMVKG